MSVASVRYEFDRLNRLVVVDPRKTIRPRRVLEGRITTDHRNRLVYRVK